MSRGYSLRLQLLNDQADPTNLGVRLGRLCIARNVPVIEVANTLGVSRQTVYNWFAGAWMPHHRCTSRIEQFLAKLS